MNMKKTNVLSVMTDQILLPSPIGNLLIEATPKGISSLQILSKTKNAEGLSENPKIKNPHIGKAVKLLRKYFSGKNTEFDLDFDLQGTDFQKKSWSALQKIPYGKTISYSTQAKSIKKPKAVRAVGSANGKNPIPILIPCHRVVSQDGSLGGYSGGLDIKRFLLKLEGQTL
jgi:methylated-DNA-[protein]-cysteine S-methyltransferase